MGKGLMIMSDI